MSGPVDGILASDIDRTLLWSHTRLGDVPAADLVCLEVLQEREWAFVTRTAMALLERLAAADVLVPVTTRTPAQVLRLRLPAYRRVLCLNGGALLVDGVPDPDHARATDALVADVDPLRAVAERLTPLVEVPFVRGLRDADGRFCYLLLTGDAGGPVPQTWREDVDALGAEAGWRVVHEQSKVYLLPLPLTKEAGLARLLEQDGGSLLAAAGDSLLDEGMLRMARHALVPADAYLTRHGWAGDLTASGGVRAGEEIARWLAAYAGLGVASAAG